MEAEIGKCHWSQYHDVIGLIYRIPVMVRPSE
jgi:hypothetical protein